MKPRSTLIVKISCIDITTKALWKMIYTMAKTQPRLSIFIDDTSFSLVFFSFTLTY